GEVRAIAFSPDGHVLASGGGIEGLDDAQVVQGKDGEDRLVAGERSRGQPGELKLWDVATGKARLTLGVRADLIETVAFHPGGRTLAAGSRDGTVVLWHLSTGKVRTTYRADSRPVAFIGFLADGRRMVTGSRDLTARIWDFPTGKELAAIRVDEDSG